MRKIGILVSCCEDVRKERALAERLIRSVAAELNLAVTFSYPNRLTRPDTEDDVTAQATSRCEEGASLQVCFWESQEVQLGEDRRNHIQNTGHYDLVICLLWSRLGAKLAPLFVMPDRGRPRSATDYEIAWALDQSKRTPGIPALHVYRNRSAPATPLESNEEPELIHQQWDSVQEFFADWAKNASFVEGCHDYRDLGEFESLFRKRFRDFVAGKLSGELVPPGTLHKAHLCEENPFRGLDYFAFEHAPFFRGRTKAVADLLDALQQQAAAKMPFILLLGPEGSGKSSLVLAGVLPALTQVATRTEGAGSWRLAVTRPAAGGTAGDPFAALAVALLQESALPELPDAVNHNGWQNLAAELREHPERAVLRFRETLDYLSVRRLNHFLDERQREPLPVQRVGDVQVAHPSKLGQAKPKARLVLVVDQLEELFAGEFSPDLEQKYIAALAAFVRCQRIFVIATLRSGFYASFQQRCGPDELTILSERFELPPPGLQEIRDMIRLPAEAAGLRFELDPETGRSLDAALMDAVLASADRLSLLEHLLSQLYQKQLPRNDGLLRWSDYRELGELEGALAKHAESVFSALNEDARVTLKPIVGQLVSPAKGEEGSLIRRTVPYRDLVSRPGLNRRQRAGAKCLIDQFIREGLFHAGTDPNKELIVSVTQDLLLRSWPRVEEMLAEAQTDYIQKSRANLKPRRSMGQSIGLTVLAGLAGLAIVAAVQWPDARILRNATKAYAKLQLGIADLASNARKAAEVQRKRPEEDTALVAKKAELAASERDALQTRMKETEGKAQLAQKNAELAASQRDALLTQLKDTEAKAQSAQKNADLATSQRDVLLTQLKDTEAKAQSAQKNADLATSQRDALQTQLKDTASKAQSAQESADLATNQRDALQTQQKDAEAKVQSAQESADLATSQRDALHTQLKDTEAKAQSVQKSAEVAASQRDALQRQLKDAEAKTQQAQKNGELVAGQRDALKAQLEETEAKAQVAQNDTKFAPSQDDALEKQLAEIETKAQQFQKNAEVATTQRDALQAQLKDTEARAQQAQKNVEVAAGQRDALQTQLEDSEAKAQMALKNAELSASQRDALQAQLKATEAEAQQAKKDAALATSQRDALQSRRTDTQAKAQLVQKNADLAASQRDATELNKAGKKAQLARKIVDLLATQPQAEKGGLSSGEPAQKSTAISANEPKSEQPQPKSADLNAALLDSQVQSAQTAGRSDLASVRVPAAGEARNEDKKGIGSTEASARIGPTPENKPVTRDQESVKLARVDQSKAAISLPTLSASPSVESISTETQTNKNAEVPAEATSLKEFVLDYIRTVESDDVSAQERFFARRVNFYREGVLSLSEVQASTERYNRKWPSRKLEPRGEPEIVHSANPNQYEVLQPFAWTVSNGVRQAEGSATLYVRVWKSAKGEFHIVHVEQRSGNLATDRRASQQSQPPGAGTSP
ncbi:MAG: AAA family ATPase [Chthoniobacterales bacterium]